MMVVLKENPCSRRVSIVLAMDAAERWTFTTFHNACGKHRADLAQRKKLGANMIQAFYAGQCFLMFFVSTRVNPIIQATFVASQPANVW